MGSDGGPDCASAGDEHRASASSTTREMAFIPMDSWGEPAGARRWVCLGRRANGPGLHARHGCCTGRRSIAESAAAKYFPPMQLPYHSAHTFPLLLAPMAGVSEAPFRQICRGMGADVVLSEFLSSEAIRRRIRN